MTALLIFVLLILDLFLLLIDKLKQRVVLGLVLFEFVDDLRTSVDVYVFDELEVLLAKEAVFSC